jgi:dTDP-4-amino-4,6-dideoxygalactose transaminase
MSTQRRTGTVSKLAIDGGEPLVGDLPAEIWPEVHEQDVEAVLRVLRRNQANWSVPDEVRALEEEWAAFVGTEYAVGYATGTASLHAAICGVGVEAGDEVLCPALTFLASAAPILHHQAIPVFVDCDPVTFNIDPARIEQAISERTRAIMVVHFGGLPADMDEILAIAARHDLAVIEDCAQAQAAEYKGRRVGGIGHVSGTSIMSGKNLPTCGEGGLLATNDVDIRERADRVQMFGEIVRRGVAREYNNDTFGYNYRLPNVQAAFARSQLARLPQTTARLQERTAAFSERLAQFPGIVPPHVPADRTHAWYLYRFLLDPQAAGLDVAPGRFRKALQDVFAAEGLPLKHYQNRPLAGQAIFRDRVGYGGGVPWTSGRAAPERAQMAYDVRDYPATLEVIERSLIVGGRFVLAHGTTGQPDRAQLWLDCFEKVWSQLDAVAEHARALDYVVPWEEQIALF